jgi:dihydroflavonol-4-reductase
MEPLMKVIVFGGTGFIGSHVVEQLTLAGRELTVVVRENSDTAFLDSLGVLLKRIDFRDEEAIARVIEGHEVVYNCLANPKLHQSLEAHRAVEVDLTQKVLTAAIEVKTRRFVQLSTIMVYGFQRPPGPIQEDYPCTPSYLFNQVAVEREQMVKQVAEAGGIEFSILRPCMTTGKRDVSFLPPFNAMHRWGCFPLFGNRETRFSCVDARDVGRAMLWLGESDASPGETYLLRGYEMSWLEFKQALDQFFDKKSLFVKIPTPVGRLIGFLLEKLFPYGVEPPLTRFGIDALTRNSLFDDSKLRATGFQTKYNFEDALREIAC